MSLCVFCVYVYNMSMAHIDDQMRASTPLDLARATVCVLSSTFSDNNNNNNMEWKKKKKERGQWTNPDLSSVRSILPVINN